MPGASKYCQVKYHVKFHTACTPSKTMSDLIIDQICHRFLFIDLISLRTMRNHTIHYYSSGYTNILVDKHWILDQCWVRAAPTLGHHLSFNNHVVNIARSILSMTVQTWSISSKCFEGGHCYHFRQIISSKIITIDLLPITAALNWVSSYPSVNWTKEWMSHGHTTLIQRCLSSGV